MMKQVLLKAVAPAGVVAVVAIGGALWTSRPIPVPAEIQEQLEYLDDTCRGLPARIASDIEADHIAWTQCDRRSGVGWTSLLEFGVACGLSERDPQDPFHSWIGWISPVTWPAFRQHWEASMAQKPPRWVGGDCTDCKQPAWMLGVADPPPECGRPDPALLPWTVMP